MHILINPLHRPAIVPGVSHSENQCHDQYRSQHHLPPAHPSCPHHAAETLVLTNALECSEIEASLVPFTDFGAMHPIRVRRHELNEAFRPSAPHVDSALNIFIASRIIALLPALFGDADTATSVDIDLSEFQWPFVVQGHRGAIIEPPRSGGAATPILVSTANGFLKASRRSD
ncbi:hypothetical protein [Sinorhizobium meliloti]|uniref:hypothetical protein n=1 Tax=Rhizobium meliloti TaxID=382 RepID=UPI002091E3DC|nr:hypothetical protein [Sinorhizobium meliloti]MCO5963912.1 hypothetical protein [Sinorhizobium meliloti]